MLRESALVGKTWPPPAPSAKLKAARQKAEDDLATARRTRKTVQQIVEAARLPAEEAAGVVNRLAGEAIPLAIAVIAEEGNGALAELVSARADAAKAEGVVRSIAAALVQRKAFPEAEHINVAVNTMPWPVPSVDPAPYLRLLDRLLTDPDAEV